MLVSTRKLLLDAQKNGYAIPAFNVYNLETISAVVEAATEMQSPVILAVTPSTKDFSGEKTMIDVIKSISEMVPIPIALHLDHHLTFENIRSSIDLGTKSVMIDASMKSYEDNVNLVKQVVDYAHRYDVTVEAELGQLVGKEDDLVVESEEGGLTDPDQAVDFVRQTGIDSLAVAIGTAHGLYKSEPKIDIERLEKINKRIDIPLVLHGASGVPENTVKTCIKHGITKVNIATELKIPFSEAIKTHFEKNPDEYDPRKYLSPAKTAVKDVAKRKILMCGSQNQSL